MDLSTILGLAALAIALLGLPPALHFLKKWRARRRRRRSDAASMRQEIALAKAHDSAESELGELTYLRYRDLPCPAIESDHVARELAARYARQPLEFAGRLFPVTVLWHNADSLIAPDDILGELDQTLAQPLAHSVHLGPSQYASARAFIKRDCEGPSSPIKHECLEYRTVSLDLPVGKTPVLRGAFGWYYDNLLTQYAMEWELRKALSGAPAATLVKPGSLPLREAVESVCDPLVSGDGRCAALTISTLIVFQSMDGSLRTLIRKRSQDVRVSPGMLHVVPAGMFEAQNAADQWSIKVNIWREMLEEVYNEPEAHGSGESRLADAVFGKTPILQLEDMLRRGSAELSVTGICCDLLNLRTEICTVLYVPDTALATARDMIPNWECESESPAGLFAMPWRTLIEAPERLGGVGIVATGAACIALGREWMLRRHGL